MLKKKLSSLNINKLRYKLRKKLIKVNTFVQRTDNKKYIKHKIVGKDGVSKNIVLKANLRPLEERFALTTNALQTHLNTSSRFRNKFIDVSLINALKTYYSSIKNKNVMKIKTYNRASTIFPFLHKLTIFVYNGKKFLPLAIEEHHIGYKLGEFIFTRKFLGHKKEGRKVVYKKKKRSVKRYFRSIYKTKNILFKKIKYAPAPDVIPKIKEPVKKIKKKTKVKKIEETESIRKAKLILEQQAQKRRKYVKKYSYKR